MPEVHELECDRCKRRVPADESSDGWLHLSTVVSVRKQQATAAPFLRGLFCTLICAISWLQDEQQRRVLDARAAVYVPPALPHLRALNTETVQQTGQYL